MRNKIHILILSAALLLSVNVAFSQNDSVAKATSILQDQSFSAEVRIKKAREIIDKAIMHPECANDGYAWYIRGFIYKDWYKTTDTQNKKSKIRLDAVEYLKKSLVLFQTDTSAAAKEYSEAIKKNFKYLSSTFYNDAGALLDPDNYSLAIENYEKFKECILIAEPAYNIKAREIEFKNALATVHNQIFLSNFKINAMFYGMTEDLYKQVIALDTNNWSGNYNLAMLNYNYGVNIVNDMSANMETILVIAIDEILEQAREKFKKALPYALKAYELNPKRKEVLQALEGIYTALYEEQKAEEFKAKVELLNKEK